MIDLLQIAETQHAINDMVSPLWPINLLLCFCSFCFFLRLNKSNVLRVFAQNPAD